MTAGATLCRPAYNYNKFRKIMLALDKNLEEGDVVEIGEIESYEANDSGGSLHLIAVHSGDCEEYVILNQRFSDGEIQSPDGSEILCVTDGKGMADPIAWYITPLSAYGGAGE